MPDFVLLDDQNVEVAIPILDDAGNVVPGVAADAGTVTAVASDTTVLEVVVSADQSSYNAKALGPEATGVTVTVNASLNGAALAPSTLAFDVNASPATTTGQVPGTPAHN
jgi:hypothetical protein